MTLPAFLVAVACLAVACLANVAMCLFNIQEYDGWRQRQAAGPTQRLVDISQRSPGPVYVLEKIDRIK